MVILRFNSQLKTDFTLQSLLLSNSNALGVVMVRDKQRDVVSLGMYYPVGLNHVSHRQIFLPGISRGGEDKNKSTCKIQFYGMKQLSQRKSMGHI